MSSEDKELKTIKFQMMLSPGDAERIDDWMFRRRLKSRAEAIRRLCQIGIGADLEVEFAGTLAENPIDNPPFRLK